MTHWHRRAACIGADPALFDQDHEKETPATKEQDEATIHRYCDGCPVKDLCLQDAISNNDVDGIRGGMTEKQRRQLKRGYVPVKSRVVEPRNTPINTEREERRFRAWESGATDRAIAEMEGCAVSTIHDWRVRRGYAPNHPIGGAISSESGISEEEHAARLELWEAFLSDIQIAAQLGKSPSGIREWRKKHGLMANRWRRMVAS